MIILSKVSQKEKDKYLVRLSGQVAQLVRQDTDFQAVFAQVGQTVARGEEWLKELAGEDGQTP